MPIGMNIIQIRDVSTVPVMVQDILYAYAAAGSGNTGGRLGYHSNARLNRPKQSIAQCFG